MTSLTGVRSGTFDELFIATGLGSTQEIKAYVAANGGVSGISSVPGLVSALAAKADDTEITAINADIATKQDALTATMLQNLLSAGALITIATVGGGSHLQISAAVPLNSVFQHFDAGQGTTVGVDLLSNKMLINLALQDTLSVVWTYDAGSGKYKADAFNAVVSGSALQPALQNSVSVSWSLDAGTGKMFATSTGGAGSASQSGLTDLTWTSQYHGSVPTTWSGNMKVALYDSAGWNAGFSVEGSRAVNISGDGFRWRKNVTQTMDLDGNGNLWTMGSMTANSDARVKTDIQDADRSSLRAIFDRTEPRVYRRTDMNDDRLDMDGNVIPGGEPEWRLGFISQELQTAIAVSGASPMFTNLVIEGSDGLLKLDYSRYTCVIASVLKSALGVIENQQIALAALTARVRALETM